MESTLGIEGLAETAAIGAAADGAGAGIGAVVAVGSGSTEAGFCTGEEGCTGKGGCAGAATSAAGIDTAGGLVTGADGVGAEGLDDAGAACAVFGAQLQPPFGAAWQAQPASACAIEIDHGNSNMLAEKYAVGRDR